MPVRTSLSMLVLLAVVIAPTVPARAASGTYVDDDRSRFEGFIETASARGLVAGCNPPDNDRFCPHRVVTRAEMAIMLDRVTDLPAAEADHFEDDKGLTAEPAINKLAEIGVTNGCDPGRFCPDRPLRRGEMAELIVRTLGWKAAAADTGRYIDVADSPHGDAATTLAARGGLDPCDPPEGRQLCPDAPVTRDEAVFALTTALNLQPERSQSDDFGPEVGFYDAFDQVDLWDGRRPSSRNRVSVTDGGYRGSGLKVGIPRGSHYGADFKLDLSDVVGEDPETLFFRYYLRLNPGWDPRDSGKLPGFSGVYGHAGKGGYQSRPSDPGWSARMKFSGNRPNDPRARLGYYVYHLGQERRYGDGMNWNEAGKLQPGEWYCIEGQVQLNTPGLSDGALRAWVDGTPAFDAAGIAFRRPSEPEIRIESFWFNVYYGGKPVAPADMGMVVDEVAVDGRRIGCDSGRGLERTATGDLTGDGYADRVWWGECAAGPCFLLSKTTESGRAGADLLGNGAWFSLETHRLGIVSTDLDGDGDSDVIYRGRCDRSERCWRVHRAGGSSLGPGENWHDGARFSSASQLVAGDFDHNGRSDIAYIGLCGSAPAHPCWRVHLSKDGGGFAPPADWGQPPEGVDGAPMSADITGDGQDDIVYAAACGDASCWFAQTADGPRFTKPVKLGTARDGELQMSLWFDFNRDRRADLLSVKPGEQGTTIEMRSMTSDGLGKPERLATTAATEVTDLMLRRPDHGPLEALALTACEAKRGCAERFVAFSAELATPERYARAMLLRLSRILARAPAPMELTYQ